MIAVNSFAALMPAAPVTVKKTRKSRKARRPDPVPSPDPAPYDTDAPWEAEDERDARGADQTPLQQFERGNLTLASALANVHTADDRLAILRHADAIRCPHLHKSLHAMQVSAARRGAADELGALLSAPFGTANLDDLIDVADGIDCVFRVLRAAEREGSITLQAVAAHALRNAVQAGRAEDVTKLARFVSNYVYGRKTQAVRLRDAQTAVHAANVAKLPAESQAVEAECLALLRDSQYVEATRDAEQWQDAVCTEALFVLAAEHGAAEHGAAECIAALARNAPARPGADALFAATSAACVAALVRAVQPDGFDVLNARTPTRLSAAIAAGSDEDACIAALLLGAGARASEVDRRMLREAARGAPRSPWPAALAAAGKR